MMDWNLSSAKAVHDMNRFEAEKSLRRRIAEDSTIESSETLKETALSIQELNRKQELQNDYLSKLIELHRIEQEANKIASRELRFINWTVLIVSIVGTAFTVVSCFR